MSSGGNKPNILPSFQANLTRRLDELHMARANMKRDPRMFWDLLDAFVDGTPREIYNEMEKDLVEVRSKLDSFLRLKGANEIDRERNIRITEINYLIPRLGSLYRKIIVVLDEKGYLVQIKGYGNIPDTNMNL